MNTPQTQAELDQAAKDCEAFAALFNNRRRVKKAKRSSHKPDFIVQKSALL